MSLMINNTGFFGSNIRCMFSIYICCFQTQMMFPNYPRGYFLVQKVCERVLGTWLYMHETVVLVRFSPYQSRFELAFHNHRPLNLQFLLYRDLISQKFPQGLPLKLNFASFGKVSSNRKSFFQNVPSRK